MVVGIRPWNTLLAVTLLRFAVVLPCCEGVRKRYSKRKTGSGQVSMPDRTERASGPPSNALDI